MSIKELWTEKYRPKKVEDYVFRDVKQKNQVEAWIEDGAIPHLLLSGMPGIGKTTLAKLLFRELKIPREDILEINASDDTKVETIRTRVGSFASQMPYGDFRYVLLDECLHEDVLVTILRNGKIQHIEIKNLDSHNDLVKSYNTKTKTIEWKPFILYDKGMQDVLEIEFENDEKIICTSTHKWYVETDEGEIKIVNASELYKYNHILTPT